MEKTIICTICPMGCRIRVVGEGENILSMDGYTCNRGMEYGKTEFLHPVRILTSTVKTDQKKTPLLPVRSEQPLPKERLFACMEEIRKVVVHGPVKRHDVVIENVCGTGVNIVATGELKQ